jgi:hypothetical protein
MTPLVTRLGALVVATAVLTLGVGAVSASAGIGDITVVTTTPLETYTAGGGYVPLDSNVTVTDDDSTMATGATITITSGLTSGDALSFTSVFGLSASFIGSTGTLTLSGSATIADYQAALRSITFRSTEASGLKTVAIVVTADGEDSAPGSISIVVAAPPTVTDVSPSNGPEAGVNTVVITGTYFDNATDVIFGATSSESFTLNSATQLTAVAPAGTGTVDVTVVTSTGGPSVTSAADQYTYVVAPTVTGLSPAYGPRVGGTTVTITGTNFATAEAVSFGGSAATFSIVDATHISATSPPGVDGVDVTVTTAGGTSASSANDVFSYLPPPTVNSLSPQFGPTAGGSTIIITGTALADVTAVSFGTTPATSFTINSSTQITAVSPAGSGTGNVRVTSPEGTSAPASVNKFSWTVEALQLSATSVDAGHNITISGSGFDASTQHDVVLHSTPVTIGTATVDALGFFSVTLTIPAGTTAGAHTIIVDGASIPLRVVRPAAVSTSALPTTGTNPDELGTWALGLLTFGAVLFFVARRRRARITRAS